ncbi:hypothetical protein Y032_0020g110 [Ancylostoma ceylanicum]|uniref:ATPase AAA-type core domain-containing protein n=2 Tax=Ancylostoma ceylanicum TaxID=53326 RepID=A0A016V1G0_9BILA|nr:hypothetical protein Y032_0020g110 [Ancylostoma ceylanicum]
MCQSESGGYAPSSLTTVDHMAAMLNSLIAVRRRGYSTSEGHKKPFQMIIITHDDHLVDKLMIGSKPEFIYVLGKDNSGISHVRRQYSDGRSEEANGISFGR